MFEEVQLSDDVIYGRSLVNNESSEISRYLGSEFNDFASVPELDFYPKELR